METTTDFNPVLAAELGLPLEKYTKPTAAFAAISEADRAVLYAAIMSPTFLTKQDPVEGVISKDPGPAIRDAVRNSRIFKTNAGKVNQEMLTMFKDLFSKAEAEKITVSKAATMVLSAFPKATRVEFKHTAASVGIKPLTARNLFDRITKAAK